MNPLDKVWEGLFTACCAALQIDPNGDFASRFFREASSEGAVNHVPENLEDVCYIDIQERKGEAPSLWQTCRGEGWLTLSHTPAQCTFSFYGRGGFGYAQRLRAGLMLDVPSLSSERLYEAPRAILRKSGIYPRLPLPGIICTPEEAAGVWRKRWEFIYPFVYTHESRTNLPFIAQPPAITIKE